MAPLLYPLESCCLEWNCASASWWINQLQKGMVPLFVPQKTQLKTKRILWYPACTQPAEWAMHATKHMTGSHQTNSPSALVQAPCACTNHRQSFCSLRFLTEGPPKRLGPPWKKIFVFWQKIKSLCICYLKLSFMDYKILCQMMKHIFLSAPSITQKVRLDFLVHNTPWRWLLKTKWSYALSPSRGQERKGNSSLIQGQYVQKNWQPFGFFFIPHSAPSTVSSCLSSSINRDFSRKQEVNQSLSIPSQSFNGISSSSSLWAERDSTKKSLEFPSRTLILLVAFPNWTLSSQNKE